MYILLRRATVILPLLVLVAFLSLATQVRDTQAGLASYSFDDTVPFAWTDISATGTVLEDISDDDDEYQSDVPIGFTFSFEGTDYTHLEPTSNGVISLDQEGEDEYDNESLPTSEWAGAALFPWWDDLYTDDSYGGGEIFAQTVGTAPNRIFIIQYDEVTHYDSEDADYVVTFQLALCEGSNNIVFQYLDTVFGDPSYPENDNGGDATVGIQATDSDALQYSNFSAVITDGLAIVFYRTDVFPNNCLAGPPPPPPTPTATDTPVATPTGTPPEVEPTPTLVSTVLAATDAPTVSLPATGIDTSGTGGSPIWLIAVLASVGLVAAASYTVLRVRSRRA